MLSVEGNDMRGLVSGPATLSAYGFVVSMLVLVTSQVSFDPNALRHAHQHGEVLHGKMSSVTNLAKRVGAIFRCWALLACARTCTCSV